MFIFDLPGGIYENCQGMADLERPLYLSFLGRFSQAKAAHIRAANGLVCALVMFLYFYLL